MITASQHDVRVLFPERLRVSQSDRAQNCHAVKLINPSLSVTVARSFVARAVRGVARVRAFRFSRARARTVDFEFASHRARESDAGDAVWRCGAERREPESPARDATRGDRTRAEAILTLRRYDEIQYARRDDHDAAAPRLAKVLRKVSL